MAITAYTGLPGHGKSYGVVENVILPALKSGRKVFTNIPMNDSLCEEKFNNKVIPFEVDDIKNNPQWFDDVFIKGALFVADEIWSLWPSGLKANNAVQTHLNFLAKHRHFVGEDGKSTEVILVTQDLSQLAAFVRTLIDFTFKVNKLSKAGLSERFRIDVYSFAASGQNIPASKRDREIHGKFSKKIYPFYQSHTLSDVGAGDETPTDTRFNILKGAKIKFIIFGFLFFFVFFAWALNSFIDNNKFTNHDDKSANSTPATINNNLKLSDVDNPVVNKDSISKKIESLDYISKASSVTYLGYLRDIDSIKHSFKVVLNNQKAILTQGQLKKMGYDIEVISDCLVIIRGFKRTNYSMCRDPESNNNGFVSNLASIGN